MSDFASTIVALTTGLWWLWAFAGTLAVAFVAGLALCVAAGRPMPAMPAGIDDLIDGDDWCAEYGPRVVYGAEGLPIFDATVAHIAKYAAVDLDREWFELNGGGS